MKGYILLSVISRCRLSVPNFLLEVACECLRVFQVILSLVPSIEKEEELTAALKAGNDFVALRFQSLLNDTDAFRFGIEILSFLC